MFRLTLFSDVTPVHVLPASNCLLNLASHSGKKVGRILREKAVLTGEKNMRKNQVPNHVLISFWLRSV